MLQINICIVVILFITGWFGSWIVAYNSNKEFVKIPMSEMNEKKTPRRSAAKKRKKETHVNANALCWERKQESELQFACKEVELK